MGAKFIIASFITQQSEKDYDNWVLFSFQLLFLQKLTKRGITYIYFVANF